MPAGNRAKWQDRQLSEQHRERIRLLLEPPSAPCPVLAHVATPSACPRGLLPVWGLPLNSVGEAGAMVPPGKAVGTHTLALCFSFRGTSRQSPGARLAVACVLCPAGHHCPEPGTATPRPCDAGSFSVRVSGVDFVPRSGRTLPALMIRGLSLRPVEHLGSGGLGPSPGPYFHRACCAPGLPTCQRC